MLLECGFWGRLGYEGALMNGINAFLQEVLRGLPCTFHHLRIYGADGIYESGNDLSPDLNLSAHGS